ncbi:hypothetical protein JHW43_008135 [Diplocarpon mali]|nr:hypothetical protein JHW43_008135 [Diplocarpon mali]
MAAAALMEEELQHSMATFEEDAEFEEDDEFTADVVADMDAFAANNQLLNGMLESKEYVEREQIGNESLTDEDAEGEVDDDMADLVQDRKDDSEDDSEDAEGVGAVKIQPIRFEDDDEDAVSGSDNEDGVSVASSDGDDDDDSKGSSDAEAEDAWVPEAEGEEEDEPVNPNRCIFCQLDEESDPSDEFELYLSCGVCGDNAHRQCARGAGALGSDDEAETWYCPDCVTNNLIPEDESAAPEADECLDPAARRISRDRIAGDLLPPQRAVKPDSHSVFNQLIAPDDPMDGSRLLRKRKASSTDTEHVEEPRRRTRENAGSSNSKAVMADAQPSEVSGSVGIEAVAQKTVLPLTNGKKKSEVLIAPRVSRSLRPKSLPSHGASIVEKAPHSIKIRFRVDPVELQHILSLLPKPKKKRSGGAAARAATAVSPIAPASYSQPFYSLHDREVDELKSKPYGGILEEKDADTSMTLPKPEHRRQFDEARQKAEDEWKARVAAAAEAAAASGVKKSRKVSGPASQIEYIEFGEYQIDIWYAAPYPEEYSRNKALFICEFCLKYMESDIVAWRHKTKCPWKHPPGDEIYRDGKVMIFEVDGRKNPLYCQNLCLLAKLFLGSKTLYYDVEPFLFYVMTEYDELGCHFVGYFSKEKRPSSFNNVSCILVLPIHQRKGYGHLLMDFSYLLTRVEKKTGSPEKPLSDMGLVSYRNYWRLVLCYYFRDFKSRDKIPSIRQISDNTGLTPDDVVSALDAMGALIRDPITGTYALKLKTDYYLSVIRQHEAKDYARLNPKGLVWTPYIMGRGNASVFDHGPPLNTVAPRDDDDDADDDSILETKSSSTSKREIQPYTNGDAEAVSQSPEKLSTESGEVIKVGKPDMNGVASPSKSKLNGVSKKFSYYEAAANIPPTRFEVFPPVPGTRNRSTPRPSGSRPTPVRNRSGLSTSSRPTPKRASSGSTPRPPSSRSRSSTSRRASGGTGRGPGRWPKGTSKADFDGADSGPGLPPRFANQRSRLGNEVLLGEEVEDEEDEEGTESRDEDLDMEEADALAPETPAMKKRRDASRGEGLGKSGLGKSGLGKPGSGKPQPELRGEAMGLGKPNLEGEGTGEGNLLDDNEDQVMVDAPPILAEMDMDAEGEDE